MSIQRAISITPPLSYWKYDVFLSFRGEDTRKNFTDHLYVALKKSGITVFKDDKKLEKGTSISTELAKAIEESRISIIVFSRNYASSMWCLDELVKIVQCMKTMKQIVIPIFYDVDPSIVRKQAGKFQEAFSKYEEAFKENMEKVREWRTALTEVANLSGCDLKDRHESEFVQDIVKEISRKIGHNSLCTFEDLVGMESRLEKLRGALMDTFSDDVCMIGIHGMGGIGKTTIARTVYDLISCEFEGSSFLSNVREISGKNGLVHLQRQLLSQILSETDINIWDVYEGIIMIRSWLRNKKVLIVIDDVDDIKQLNELIGKHEWFGSGSRIIITTRDKHLLITHGVDMEYEAEQLDDVQELKLFTLKAFKNCHPLKEYMELSKRNVKYGCGLPLALEVLGSFLHGRTVDEWESALQRLGKDYEKGILDSLQISFDGLKETEKKIFLDVACFFKGKDKDHVTRILEACGFNPTIGIRVLVDKSLIIISCSNVLWMHDLLQEMGQQLVKRESPEEPGKYKRLWKEADVYDVLTRNMGTEVIEGVVLENEIQYFSLSAKVFSKMTNLRLLKICNVQLPEGLEYLSNNLRLLDWHGYPLKSLPSSLQLDKTVELKMHDSRIEQLWKETKPLNKLKVISLIHSKNLNKTPDFTVVPNLEELILEGCTGLCEIHPSLLVHKKLILLSLKDCTSLTALPRKMDMESLKTLVFSGCSKLKTFPEIGRGMGSLLALYLDRTPIKELPFPVEHLKGIVLLSMEDCKNLVSLPSNINGFKSIKTLELSGCSKLKNLPENLGHVECLEKLDLSGIAIRQPMSSIFVMKKLKELSFRGCGGLQSSSWYMRLPFSLMSRRNSDPMGLVLPSFSGLPSLTNLNLSDCNLGEGAICNEIGSLVSLTELNLGNNNFVSLPASINRLSKLRYLTLTGNRRLQLLPELPSNLHEVDVDNCTSLKSLPNAVKLCHLRYASCVNCFKLIDGHSLACSKLKGSVPRTIIFPGSEIPKWVSHRSEGSSIRIKCCPNLKIQGVFVCAALSSSGHVCTIDYCCKLLRHTEVADSLRKYPFFNTVVVDFLYKYPFSSANGLSDHLWLCYDPLYIEDPFKPDFWCQYEFNTSNCPATHVRKCAAYPVYEQDLGEFDHLTDPCSSSVSGNLIEFHQDFVATSEVDVSTAKRSLADHNEAETSGIGEESQLRRQKNSKSSLIALDDI